MSNFSAEIDFRRFVGAGRVTLLDGNKQPVQGIFIPEAPNNIVVEKQLSKKTGTEYEVWRCSLYCVETPKSTVNSHMIKISMTKEESAKGKETGQYPEKPIIGNLRRPYDESQRQSPTYSVPTASEQPAYGSGYTQQTVNPVTTAPSDGDDDLPF